MTNDTQRYPEGEPIDFLDILQEDYATYAILTNVGRAIPSIIDGLKPVQRRILYTMWENKYFPTKAPVKSLMIASLVTGKYHPHGDCYLSMTNMSNMSTRIPLVTVHGSYGRRYGAQPAASRYTDATISEQGMYLLDELKYKFVDMEYNYDDSMEIAKYLPAQFPNLLVNGAEGTAVAYATKIPQHNPTEVCEAVKYRIDNPDCSVEDLMKIIPGPDYSTGGYVVSEESEIESYYRTGTGSATLVGKYEIDGPFIVLRELPYGVNGKKLTDDIKKKVIEEKIVGISDLKDLTDRVHGLYIQVRVKRGASHDSVISQLMEKTEFKRKISYNMNAVDEEGRTRLYGLVDMLDKFIEHRGVFVRKRSEKRISENERRLKMIAAIKSVLIDIDEAVSIIRKSSTPDVAKKKLSKSFSIDTEQAEYILSMQLRSLTNQNRTALDKEQKGLEKENAHLNKVMKSDKALGELVSSEIDDVAAQIGDNRRTVIVDEMGVDVAAAEVSEKTSDSGWYLDDNGMFSDNGPYPFNDGDRAVLMFEDGRIKTTAGKGLPKNISATMSAPNLEGLIGSKILGADQSIVIVTAKGKVLRIAGDGLNDQGIAGNGVKGISLAKDDSIVGFSVVSDDDQVLTVSDKGWKVTAVGDIPTKGRGTSGVILHKMRKGETDVVDFATGKGFSVNSAEATPTPRSKATTAESVQKWESK